MNLFNLIKHLLLVESDTDLILEDKCPECEEPMPEDDNDDGALCFLCPNCRKKFEHK